MNRLFHLKETYKKNLNNAPNAEFILLDYGSSESIENWVKEEFSEYFDRFKFYRTEDPQYWVAAHAKNIAHKQATGDILCNLDCDITIPEKFCEFIEENFSKNPNIVLAFKSEDFNGNMGCAGMIIARKEHFYSVNGYDENINLGWGYDDVSYQYRTKMQNNLQLIVVPPLISCIPHSNSIRTANCQLKDIQLTKEISKNICAEYDLNKDYISNKNIDWGNCSFTTILPG